MSPDTSSKALSGEAAQAFRPQCLPMGSAGRFENRLGLAGTRQLLGSWRRLSSSDGGDDESGGGHADRAISGLSMRPSDA